MSLFIKQESLNYRIERLCHQNETIFFAGHSRQSMKKSWESTYIINVLIKPQFTMGFKIPYDTGSIHLLIICNILKKSIKRKIIILFQIKCFRIIQKHSNRAIYGQ